MDPSLAAPTLMSDLLGTAAAAAAAASSSPGGAMMPPPSLPRSLQGQPDYTSPPTEFALAQTPEQFRSDDVIDGMRQMDADGLCTAGTGLPRDGSCQILFEPPSTSFVNLHPEGKKLGAILYGGALVDPRSYSPLAATLRDRYGLAVSIPVFEDDLAFGFGSCDTGRIPLAAEAFPEVEGWVLVGHSLGGIAFQTDLFTLMTTSENSTSATTNTTMTMDSIQGMVFLGSYISQDLGCGPVDFSETILPAASVSGSLDLIVNATNFEMGKAFLPSETTFHLDILGGNHAQFGSYDGSEREELLDQVDGTPLIPEAVQRDLSAGAIANVAFRTAAVPDGNETVATTTTTMTATMMTTMIPSATATTTAAGAGATTTVDPPGGGVDTTTTSISSSPTQKDIEIDAASSRASRLLGGGTGTSSFVSLPAAVIMALVVGLLPSAALGSFP